VEILVLELVAPRLRQVKCLLRILAQQNTGLLHTIRPTGEQPGNKRGNRRQPIADKIWNSWTTHKWYRRKLAGDSEILVKRDQR